MLIDAGLHAEIAHSNRLNRLLSQWGTKLAATASIIIVLTGTVAIMFHAGLALPLQGQKASASSLRLQDIQVEPDPAEVLQVQLRRLAGSDPVQEYTLHKSAGQIYQNHGRLADASFHFKKAVELARQNEDRAAALVALGTAKLFQGRISESRKQLEKAVLIADHDSVYAVNAIHALANARRDLGHATEAIRLYQQAWDLGLRQGAVDTVQLPRVAADMAEAHARRGQKEKALFWLKEAQNQIAALRRKFIGQHNHEELEEAQVYSLLAATYQQSGQVTRAMEFYHKALLVQVRTLPGTHTDLIATRLGLARAQRDLGDRAEAQRTIAQAELIIRGGAHEGPDLSRCLVLKADLRHEAQDLEGAKTIIKEAIMEQERQFGDEQTPEKAVALNTYGSILHDQAQLNEAHKQYMKALRVNLATVGEWHPETAATYNSLGTLFQDANSLDMAREHFQKCLQIQLASIGEASPGVANTYNNLATIRFRQGEVKEASELLRKALKVLDSADVPSTNPDRAIYLDNLSQVELAVRQGSKVNTRTDEIHA